MTAGPLDWLRGLHVLADAASRWKHDPPQQAEHACAGGASLVQLRAKQAPDREVLAWGREIREITRAHDVLFIVNDRFDLAVFNPLELGIHAFERPHGCRVTHAVPVRRCVWVTQPHQRDRRVDRRMAHTKERVHHPAVSTIVRCVGFRYVAEHPQRLLVNRVG